MKLAGTKVLITGGSGGIGSELARAFLAQGARVLLTGRSAAALERTRHALADLAGADTIAIFPADLTIASERDLLCAFARKWQGGIDVLVNNAGLSEFGLLEEQAASDIEATVAANVLAPIQLCRNLLPHLLTRPAASIVNIGSVFGSLGYPGFAVYSATKFALRGFSEALRRELADSQVTVHYFAPRATRTAFNDSVVDAMNEELGTAVDTPRQVAEQLCALLSAGRSQATLGWPEQLFVKLNSIFPALIDRSLLRQLPVIRKYARPAADLDQETTVIT